MKKIEKFMSNKLERPFTLSDDTKAVIRKLLHDFRTKWQDVTRIEKNFFTNITNKHIRLSG